MKKLLWILLFPLPIFAQTVTGISIAPKGAVMRSGSTVTFTATCNFSSGPPGACPSAVFASTNSTDTTVNSSTGVVTQVTNPTTLFNTLAYITVTQGSFTDKAAIFGQHTGDTWVLYMTPEPFTCNNSITSVICPLTLAVGGVAAVGEGFTTAAGRNTGSPLNPACTWSSTFPTVATVDSIGHVTGVSSTAIGDGGVAGRTTISCSVSGNGDLSGSGGTAPTWVAPGNTIQINVVAGGTGTNTWYVRPDGGTPYVNATQTPVGQCSGLVNAPYPGSGVNQPCAMASLQYLYADQVSYQTLQWMIAGGDEVIVMPGSYQMGADANTDSNCHGNDFGCYMPPIPNGTPSRHTYIHGSNAGSCHTDAAKPELWGTRGMGEMFNIALSSYVDVACFNVDDHVQSGPSGFTNHCADCGLSYGIFSSALDSFDTFTDVNIHGAINGAWLGATGGAGIVFDHGRSYANADVGFNLDGVAFGGNYGIGNIYTSGGMTMTYTANEFSGCVEQYPIALNYPIVECRESDTGGYGDAVGTGTTNGDWTFDHDFFLFCLEDCLDLLHSGFNSLTVTNNWSEAARGQQYKIGSGNNIIFRNNVSNGDCDRILLPWGDMPSGAITPGISPCRAGATNVLVNTTPFSTDTFQGNTFTSDAIIALELEMEFGYLSATTANTILQNNIIISWQNLGDPPGQNVNPLFSNTPGSLPGTNGWATQNNNIYYNIAAGKCPGAGEPCNTTNPAFVNQLPGTSVSAATAFDYFNTNMTGNLSGTNPAGLILDLMGATRATPSSMGAIQYFASPTSTSVALASSASSVPVGTSVTLTSTLTPTLPFGVMTFYDGGTPLTEAYVTPNSTEVHFMTSSLSVGTHSLTAGFTSSSDFGASTSSPIIVTVTGPSTGVMKFSGKITGGVLK